MAYLEEILPEIRKGRKARRKGLNAFMGAQLYEHAVLADDWELMPEPVKHKIWIGLFEDGDSVTAYNHAKVYEYAQLHAKNMEPLKSPKIVEVREIEWSVE
jgi:hypothetical protein